MNAFAVPQLAWPSDAELVMPGSKSIANRMLVAAALSGGDVTLNAVSPSDDVRHMIAGLRTLGFPVAYDEVGERAVVGARRMPAPRHGELFCGNAGTALRFLVSVAAITPGEWTLTGDAAMQRRPIAPLVAAWRELGVEIEDTNGCPPVRMRGSDTVRGGVVRLDASVSSQFASSLMLVGAWLPDGIDITFTGERASFDYVSMTRDVLQRFGVRTTLRAWGARVEPGGEQRPDTVWVDGDASSDGVWTCLLYLTGSGVWAQNMGSVRQPDTRLSTILWSLPPRGDRTIDVSPIPDQFMNLAIVAAHHAGTTRLTGARNLRFKESDRVAVMARELAKVGVDVDELPDGLVIRGGRALRPATIDPANDHRVAMAFALAGLLSPGIAIADPGCVTKSYPAFWTDLATVTRQRRCVAVIGMRGAGKSTFARAFAAATGAELADTDELFVAKHGSIAAYVAQHGWPAFRECEQSIVLDAVRAGAVVATGGGAIESPAVRNWLRESAVAVWLDADSELLRARLAAAPHDRPSLTGAPVADEIPELLARRRPLYEQAARVRIDAALPVAAQVDAALRALGAPCRWPGANTPD